MPTMEHELALVASGCRVVAGVDEAGRGPLAGPVSVAAVVLPKGF
jgi:ribonuclease HII